nr:tripartite motif-containing protein 46 isoform X1 [Manis javanica]
MTEPTQDAVPNLDPSARPHPTTPPLWAASEPAVVMATRARLSHGRCQPCSPPPLPSPSLPVPPSFVSAAPLTGMAAKRGTKTSMKNMEKELLCPVCQETYKQPLVLPCTHNVCQACAREVLGQQGYVGHGGDPSSEPTSPASTPSTRSPRLSRRTLPKPDRLDRLLKSGFGTYPGRKRGTLHPQVIMFPCPACQCDVELGERGLAGLFRNLTLERVVERYRQSVSVGGAILCQLCKPPPLEATKGCTECRATFCNECFKLFHPWGTQKAQHEPTLPTLSFRPKGLMCPDHKEEVSHYCKTCQRLVCQLCRVRRTHSGHKITPVLSAYQALKDKLTKSLTYILGNQDTVQTQICELEETVRHTEVSGQQAKEEVSQLVRGLGALLEEKRASLLQAIEECQQERLAHLSAQIQEHRSLLDGSGLVGYAQEVLKETDQPCFVQAAKQLHNRIARATEALQTYRPAASSSFRHCQLDVGREMKLLTELNFLRVPEAPVIDTQRTFAYDQIFLCWRLPPHSPPAWHYTIEFRRTDVPAQPGPTRWQRREEVRGTSALLENPDTGSVYVLRVRGCNKAGYGEYSEDVHLHTPPAPGEWAGGGHNMAWEGHRTCWDPGTNSWCQMGTGEIVSHSGSHSPALELECPGSNPSSASCQLCGFGRIIHPFELQVPLL